MSKIPFHEYWSNICNMVVGFFEDKNEMTPVWIILGSMFGVVCMTVLLVILPWHIDAVGHDAPLLHSVLVIVALATGITVWHRIIRWKSIINDFVEGILDGEIRARQEQEQRMTAKTNELEARLDSNAKELSRQYDDKINRLTTDLNDMLSSLPRQVYGMEKNMDTLVHKMGQLEALAKNALEANNAKTDKLKDNLDELNKWTPKIENVKSDIEIIKSRTRDTKAYVAGIEDIVSQNIDEEHKEFAYGEIQSKAPAANTPITRDILQRCICDEYESYGFMAQTNKIRSKPGIMLLKDSNMCAVLCLRDREIPYHAERRTKRISRKMFSVDLKLAEEYNVPLALLVINTANNRKWLHIIHPDSMKDLKGVTTPEILAQNDKVSANTLETEYKRAVTRIGGMA